MQKPSCVSLTPILSISVRAGVRAHTHTHTHTHTLFHVDTLTGQRESDADRGEREETDGKWT
jgi:hypothetical protein